MRRFVILGIALAMLLALVGCSADEPVVVSREALGTVVSITAYGEDEASVREAVENAYTAMAEVQAQIDSHNPETPLSQFNSSPYTPTVLPPEALAILDEVAALGASADYSPTLLGVSKLYRFEEGGPAPDGDALSI
ncbi:MAG: FAD:protein FMN transferase, partial [Coriobacteriia bacterium]|nr:FAD:protein FMN transferase [Coriobacteriia bacterium]